MNFDLGPSTDIEGACSFVFKNNMLILGGYYED